MSNIRCAIAGLIIGLFASAESAVIRYSLNYYLDLPPRSTYEELAWWHVRDHCGFPANIDAWATCTARESDKFRELQIQLAVKNLPNI